MGGGKSKIWLDGGGVPPCPTLTKALSLSIYFHQTAECFYQLPYSLGAKGLRYHKVCLSEKAVFLVIRLMEGAWGRIFHGKGYFGLIGQNPLLIGQKCIWPISMIGYLNFLIISPAILKTLLFKTARKIPEFHPSPSSRTEI